MNATISILWNFLERRTCLGCGSFFRSAGFTCPICWDGLIDDWSVLFRSEIRLKPGLIVRPLFHWIPGESDLLSKLLLSHKGSGHRREWAWAAEQCLTVKEGFLPETHALARQKELIFIPAPSPTGRLHAREFAEAFGRRLRVPVVNALKAGQEQKRQRERSRFERSKRSLFLAEEFTRQDLRGKRVILVDDVVTTGFTAEAARQALGLSELEVWCLAHRRRLAANP